MSKLLHQTHCFALLTDTICILQDRFSRTLIGAGEERDGVYFFKEVMAARVSVSDTDVGSDDQFRWHQRLGHPSFSVLSSLKACSFSNKSDAPSPCDTCFRAKQTREVFYDSSNKTKECFKLIHCDVWGPYRTKSSSGAAYFLTIVDDFSRSVWTYLLLEKSEVHTVLQNYMKMTVKQFGKEVKVVRSDNGTEFMCLSNYFREQGILHQTSCVATPQQNGRVERKHRHILNVSRALLFQANIPVKFWGEAILTASHLINCTSSKVLKWKSPYEILYGELPSYSHLRVFGCLCYVHLKLRDKNKFSPRSARFIFVGYPYGQKGWKVYDLEKKEFFISRDVIFHETEFPMSTVSVVSSPTALDKPQVNTSSDEDWEILPAPLPVEIVPKSSDRGSSDTTVVSSAQNNAEPSSQLPSQVQNTQHETSIQETEHETSVSPQVPPTETSIPTEKSGCGQRSRAPLSKLQDYVMYNAR